MDFSELTDQGVYFCTRDVESKGYIMCAFLYDLQCVHFEEKVLIQEF